MKALLSVLLVLFGSNCIYASDYYWVGGTGNWNDYALHWATTSGGSVFFTSAPGNGDDVHFDQNSFSSSADNVLITGSVRCHSFNFDNSRCTGYATAAKDLQDPLPLNCVIFIH